MNDDERFEERLRGIARAAIGDDPTRQWKADILAAVQPRVRLMPPRLLLFAWAIAWAAIGLLAWSVPEESDSDLPVAAMPSPAAPILFAHQRQLLEQLDLP